MRRSACAVSDTCFMTEPDPSVSRPGPVHMGGSVAACISVFIADDPLGTANDIRWTSYLQYAVHIA